MNVARSEGYSEPLAPLLAVHEDTSFPGHQGLSPFLDERLLQQLRPDLPENATPFITRNLNRLIAVGSHAININETTTSEAQEITEARTVFYRQLGWYRPGHEMKNWYSHHLSNNPHGLNPGMTIQNIRFIQNLYGPSADLRNAVKKAACLVDMRPETLEKGYTHLSRLANVFGWEETEVRTLVQTRPTVLDISSEARYLYARVAADHAGKLALQNSPEGLLDSRLSSLKGADLMAYLADTSQSIKRFQSGKNEQRSQLLLALNNPQRQQRVGEKVLQAYFRRTPIRNLQLFESYPNLRQFHKGAVREQERRMKPPQIEKFSSEDAWLQAAALPGKAIDIAALNEYAQQGSRQLHRSHPDFQKLREITNQARKNFIEELGWNDPGHPLFGLVQRVIANPRTKFPTSKGIAGVIEVLEQSELNAMHCISILGMRGWRLLALKPETVKQRIEVVWEVFPDRDVLKSRPTLLINTLEAIRKKGEMSHKRLAQANWQATA
ncbi:MAG TPA: hypothetical protein VJR27_03045 [Candidatus Saccharimonadales bacterium]|nr:hypothetical protein [Candidatus Saccharimonadales bacterium]